MSQLSFLAFAFIDKLCCNSECPALECRQMAGDIRFPLAFLFK